MPAYHLQLMFLCRVSQLPLGFSSWFWTTARLQFRLGKRLTPGAVPRKNGAEAWTKTGWSGWCFFLGFLWELWCHGYSVIPHKTMKSPEKWWLLVTICDICSFSGKVFFFEGVGGVGGTFEWGWWKLDRFFFFWFLCIFWADGDETSSAPHPAIYSLFLYIDIYIRYI